MRRLAILIALSFFSRTSSAQSWEPVGGEAFAAVAGMSDGALVMVREPGDILRSSDHGATWHRVYHGLTSLTGFGHPSPGLSQQVGEENSIFAFYDNIAVLVSRDTGRTWRGDVAHALACAKPVQPKACDTRELTQAKAYATIRSVATVDSVCYAVGAPGLVYVSDASKARWRRLHRAPFSSAGAEKEAGGCGPGRVLQNPGTQPAGIL